MTCEHDWQPLTGWYGRYRCPRCGVFGYKPIVVTVIKNSDKVVPYKCSVSGCEGFAVAKDVSAKGVKSWRCTDHRLPNQ